MNLSSPHSEASSAGSEIVSLEEFFDNAAIGLHIVGEDGTILRANRFELTLLGYDEDEYVGRHIAEFHADEEVICDILNRLKGNQTIKDYPARLRCKDGSIKHVLITSNVYWKDGKFIHTRCFTRDVTPVHQQTKLLEAILNRVQACIVLVDPKNGDVKFANDAAKKMGSGLELNVNEFSPDWFLTDEDGNLVPLNMYPRCRAARGERISGVQYRWHTPEKIWDFLIYAEPLPAMHGLPPTALVSYVDLTELKRTKEALELREEQFSTVFNSAAVGMAQADPATGRLLRVNTRFCEITGYTAEELRRLKFSDITHPDDRIADFENFKKMVSGAAPEYLAEKRYLKKNGEIVWVSVNAALVRDSEGNPKVTVATIQDITGRVQAERKLRDQLTLTKTITDNAASCLFMMDKRGHPTFMNPAAEKLTGYKLENIEGRPLHYAVHYKKPDGSPYP
ncbi:MAG TPA: PAS domain S-box protein, partial [Bdellovibrionales bacterium]|nr:PAS domain S-box protein [Bdellovibrionales bacterium]